jgi:hypothetical protein
MYCDTGTRPSLSLEAIARALKISKGVVAKYLRLADGAGTWLADAGRLRRCGAGAVALPASAAREPTFAEPDYALVHQELKKKGVTLRCSGKSIGKRR